MDIYVNEFADSGVRQGSNKARYFFLGAVAGFFFGILSIFVLEYWNNLDFEK